MEKVVVFIDAGYLYSGACQSVYNQKIPRSLINIDVSSFITYIKNTLIKDNEKLLRIYWYDGVMPTGMTPEQQSVSLIDNIKFRKGIINEFSEQKKIDTQIIKDIFELSYHKSFSRGILLSADGDLVVTADIAQKFGIEIDLLTIPNTNVSLELKQEVDHLITMPDSFIESIISCKNPNINMFPEEKNILNLEVLQNIIYLYLKKFNSQQMIEMQEIFKISNGSIPHEIDKNLLSFSKNELSRLLETNEKRILRDFFYKNIIDFKEELHE